MYWLISDTFASKVAAQNDQYADSSIGNVTGSNAVNVFLGIGIAWTLAAVVHAYRGTTFVVDPGSLTYSVTLFSICAFLCCLVLMVRRRIGGELGGPVKYKWPTVILLMAFWLFYVLMSSLEAYKIIPGFWTTNRYKSFNKISDFGLKLIEISENLNIQMIKMFRKWFEVILTQISLLMERRHYLNIKPFEMLCKLFSKSDYKSKLQI